jgi:hypothetical protein
MNRPPLLTPIGSLSLVVGLVLATSAGCTSTSRFDGPGGDQRLYEARCGFCHVPFAPGDFHPDDWPALVEEMGPRAGLNAAYRERVTKYVVRESVAAWKRRSRE